eukprot:TRINITY_DN8360_c0_g1_i1.p1 TRINITY_DN8360_c0_g1~~TRINITY_DN8360_c0_g1_i1.p1  ORF type:complete len:552 (-),score=119.17 TRINITY_DN8360_c0_g1_i1:60-1568(-)
MEEEKISILSLFQPIVWAVDRSGKSFDALSETDRYLLPVGNVPLFMFSVTHLIMSGFSEVVLVVSRHVQDQYKSALNISKGAIPLESVRLICVDDEASEMEALRVVLETCGLKDAKKDFLLYRADIISSSASIVSALNLHIALSSVCTTMTLHRSPPKSRPVPQIAGEEGDTSLGDIIGREKEDPRKLLFFESRFRQQKNEKGTSSEDAVGVNLSASMLHHRQHMSLSTKMAAIGVHIFRSDVIPLIYDKQETFHSIEKDLITYLVRNQFKMETTFQPSPSTLDRIAQMSTITASKATRSPASVSTEALSPIGHAHSRHALETGEHDRNCEYPYPMIPYACCTYEISSGQCVIVDSYRRYLEACLLVGHDSRPFRVEVSRYIAPPKQPDEDKSLLPNVGDHCVVPHGTHLGEGCIIKHSILGEGCTVETRAKISDSVLHSGVRVLPGATVRRSIIASLVLVPPGITVEGCVVCAGYNFPIIQKNFQNALLVPAEKEWETDAD